MEIVKMDIKKAKEIMAMSSEERQKQIKEFWSEEDLKELDKIGKGILVGESYNFLFEGKNNEYDEEYKDYINQDKKNVKVDKARLAVIKSLVNVKDYDDYKTATIDFNDFAWLIKQVEKYEKALEDIVDLEKGIEELQSFSYEQAEKIRELEVNVSDFERVVEEQTKEIEELNKALDIYVEEDIN
jgi:hypothetical protein